MMDIRHEDQSLKSVINDCVDSSWSKEEKMHQQQEGIMRGILLLMETTRMKVGRPLVGCGGDRRSDYDV